MPAPLTIRYGSWSPDLANSAIDVSRNLDEVPSADVNNVYFADAAWRCLPSPNPYAYSVGVLLSTTFVTAIDGSLTGFDANVGSIAQAADANGNTLLQLTSDGTQIILSIQGANLGASYFSSLVYSTGTNPAVTLNTSAASYAYASSSQTNTWTWTTATAFAPGITYALLLEAFAGEAVLNALTYYDEVANQEVVFAASADGIAALVDGIWTNLTLFGLAGSTISVAAPSFALTSVLGGIVGPNQAASFKAQLSLGAPSYLGQLYSGTLSAGAGSGPQNATGFASGSFGALTPPSDINGHAITVLESTNNQRAQIYETTLTIAATLPQNYFSSMTFPNQKVTFLSGAAFYSSSGGSTTWKWSSQTFQPITFAAGVNYPWGLNR